MALQDSPEARRQRATAVGLPSDAMQSQWMKSLGGEVVGRRAELERVLRRRCEPDAPPPEKELRLPCHV